MNHFNENRGQFVIRWGFIKNSGRINQVATKKQEQGNNQVQ